MPAGDSKQEDDGFDELPSLFPVELSKGVKIFTIKHWLRAKLLMKKVARELRVSYSGFFGDFNHLV